MNQTDQLHLFCFMLGTVTGFSIATLIYLLKNRKLKHQGQKLIDKMVAKKQVDFWFNETVKTFAGAAEAHSIGDTNLLSQYSDQHALATRRFEQARLNLLKLNT